MEKGLKWRCDLWDIASSCHGKFRLNEAVLMTEPSHWTMRNQAALVHVGLGTSGATQSDKVYLAKLEVSHT